MTACADTAWPGNWKLIMTASWWMGAATGKAPAEKGIIPRHSGLADLTGLIQALGLERPVIGGHSMARILA